MRVFGGAHQTEQSTQRMANQEWLFASFMVNHFGEICQFLDQKRPVAGDRITCVVAKLFNRSNLEAAPIQVIGKTAVGTGWKTIAMRKNDVVHQINFSSGVEIFLSGECLPDCLSGIWVASPFQTGSSKLSNMALSFLPQLSRSMLK